MLTYRLTGTTEDIGVDHDEPSQSRPHHPPTASGAESSRTQVRLEDGAALLTCDDAWDFERPQQI